MTLHAYREDGTEVRPGETVTMTGTGDLPFTFRAATVASSDSGVAGMIKVDGGLPDMYARPFGLTVRSEDRSHPGRWPMTLVAFDVMTGAETRPGDTIRSLVTGQEFRFYAATRATEAGRDGKIQIGLPGGTGGREYHAGLFGLNVSLVPAKDDPAWDSAGTGEPGDIQRDIRGPGGFWALVGPDHAGRWDWSVIDSSDGETVASGNVDTQGDGRQAVTDWERAHGLVPETGISDRSEPAHRDLRAILADLDEADHRTPKARSLGRELEAAVRAQLARTGDADELAGQADRAARRMAPPVPGVTANTGHTVYAVLPSGRAGRWWVAMKDEREHVTWEAETCPDGTLAYNTGHYHTGGEGSGSEAEALIDLASRAGIFRMLTDLCSGTVARAAFQASHAEVLGELSGVYGVGRARVRSGLLEAVALSYARISWHDRDGLRKDYGISYDRVKCTFSWRREN